MLIIGITGGIGSGKSTVASMFEDLGIEIVDADQLAREVVEPGNDALTKIEARFGNDVIDAGGGLERNKMREIVFHNAEHKDWLEKLLHPLIADLMKYKLSRCRSDYAILVSPLLFETEQHKLVDRVLVIDVSERTQRERAMSRDQSNELTIKSIIASQIGRQERLDRADDTLGNEGTLDSLQSAVLALHERYLELAKEKNEPNPH